MDIENSNLAELKEIAKEKGLKNISKLLCHRTCISSIFYR